MKLKLYLLLPFFCMLMATTAWSQIIADGAKEHFQEHLESCGINEVRCLYYGHNTVGVGMIMTIDLNKYEVYTVRDVHNHSWQNQDTRKMSHSQITSVRSILKELPPSDENVPYEQTLFIAFQHEKKVEIRKYLSTKPSAQVKRLYDLGGGYLEGAN